MRDALKPHMRVVSLASLVVALLVAIPASYAGGAKPTARVVALTPPEAVQARHAAKGTPWRPLSPSATAAYAGAIAAKPKHAKPSVILSLGATGPEQQFYVVYPGGWSNAAFHDLVLVSETPGGGLVVRSSLKPTSLATSPLAATRKAAGLLVQGYVPNPRASFLGATTRGTLLFMGDENDRLAEIPVFANAGKVTFTLETKRKPSFAPGALTRRLADAGIELENGALQR